MNETHHTPVHPDKRHNNPSLAKPYPALKINNEPCRLSVGLFPMLSCDSNQQNWLPCCWGVLTGRKKRVSHFEHFFELIGQWLHFLFQFRNAVVDVSAN